jgi:predicted RNA-binding Zn ribbon-like protein
MMFDVQVETTADGQYEASCSDPMVSMRGATSASALELLRAEIRYRLEMCPCSSVDDDYVQLRVGGG